MAKGQVKVITKGRPGTQRVTYQYVYENGKLVARTKLTVIVIRAAVTQVQKVGTKPSASSSGDPGAVGGSAAGLNWAALAQCESGGNPRAVNPDGYYGLYQFSLSTWHSVGGTRQPDRRLVGRADPPRDDPVQQGRSRPVGLRQPPVRLTRPGLRGWTTGCSDRRRSGRSPLGSASGRPRPWARTSSSTPTRSAGSSGWPRSAPDDTVLEVGPGLGSLTLGLLDQAAPGGGGRDRPGAGRRAARTRSPPGGRTAATGSRCSPPTRCTSTECPVRPRPPWWPTCRTTSPYPSLLHPAGAAARACAGSWSWCRPRSPSGWRPRPGRGPTASRASRPPGTPRCAGPASVGRAVFWPVPNVDSGLVALTRREPPPSTAGRAAVFAVHRRRLRPAPQDAALGPGRLGRVAPPRPRPR